MRGVGRAVVDEYELGAGCGILRQAPQVLSGLSLYVENGTMIDNLISFSKQQTARIDDQ
jgi:hypothetical protein